MEEKKLNGDVVFRLVFVLVGVTFLASFFGIEACSRVNRPKVGVAAFYAESFALECVSGTETVPAYKMVYLDPLRMAFTRVEYVKELPPVARRAWGVVYIAPGASSALDETGQAIDRLNEIIADDSSIDVPANLTLPLTTDQVLSEPDAVIGVIKQLDREQWEEFFDKYRIYSVEIIAYVAGIEVPTG